MIPFSTENGSTLASVSFAATPPPSKPSDSSSTPTKLSSSATRMYCGVDTAKKQLFGVHPSASAPVATISEPSNARRGFERREEQLWTKLFSI